LAIYLAYLVIKCLENSKRSNKNDKDDKEIFKNEKKNKAKTDALSYEESTFIDPDQIDETSPPPYSLKAVAALIYRGVRGFLSKDEAETGKYVLKYHKVPQYDM
jgi:hypothetical protein